MKTLAEHTNALAGYLPGGRLFSAKYKTTSNIYKLLAGIANEMLTTDELIKTFRTEVVPSLTVDLLPDWESAVGIPDGCFNGVGTIVKRRTDVLTKLAALGVQTVADFEQLALVFGVTVTVVPGIEENGTGDPDDRFRIYVRHTEFPAQTFPLTFPISFGSASLSTITCLFDKLKPANCAVVFKQIGWDLTQASYDNKSFSVTTEDISPHGLFFKPDGLSMYMVGTTTDTVYQYSLSVAWDISTASYASKSFSVVTQEASPTTLSFKDDGLSMYILGAGTNTVYQYTLSTAWDVSTASYASKSFSVAAQENNTRSLSFKNDGTKMYTLGVTNSDVFQYSLSTAWDVSTASYDSISFSVTSEDAQPGGMFFKPNGLSMYTVSDVNNTVYQYSLSSAWDMSTASYDSVSFSIAGQELSPTDVFFKSDDGTKMYIIGITNDTVYQYKVD